MSGDQSRYINHAKNPNIGDDPNETPEDEEAEGAIFDTRFALRDIAAGEELTEFYFMEEDDDDNDD